MKVHADLWTLSAEKGEEKKRATKKKFFGCAFEIYPKRGLIAAAMLLSGLQRSKRQIDTYTREVIKIDDCDKIKLFSLRPSCVVKQIAGCKSAMTHGDAAARIPFCPAADANLPNCSGDQHLINISLRGWEEKGGGRSPIC